MFNKNFYPTPKDVVNKMLQHINFSSCPKILEPSAGKGDILDVIVDKYTNSYYWSTRENILNYLHCIEINDDLQAILQKKGYSIIDYDFLKHQSDYFYDYIIMNPPFEHGVKHLLKAFEICKGAEIICLLNAESINNPYTKERQLLIDIITQNNGEFINLGQCFSDAERKTNVEVVMVRLKDQDYQSHFDFKIKSKGKETHFDFKDISHNQVAKRNMFENLVDQYNKTKEAFSKYVTVLQELDYYSSHLIDEINGIHSVIQKSESNNYQVFYNNFIDHLRESSWKNIFNKTKISNVITQRAKDDFYKIQDQQGHMSFTVENMENLFYMLYMNQENIMNRCIEDAFDLLTKYHKENRVYVEGWKSNDNYKVNKKFILPNLIDNYFNRCNLHYRAKDQVADIEKALCFISGKKYVNIDSIVKQFNLHNNDHPTFGKLYESEFFKFRCYKKGTMHFVFKDNYIYEQFNLIACQCKNWIGSKAS